VVVSARGPQRRAATSLTSGLFTLIIAFVGVLRVLVGDDEELLTTDAIYDRAQVLEDAACARPPVEADGTSDTAPVRIETDETEARTNEFQAQLVDGLSEAAGADLYSKAEALRRRADSIRRRGTLAMDDPGSIYRSIYPDAENTWDGAGTGGNIGAAKRAVEPKQGRQRDAAGASVGFEDRLGHRARAAPGRAL